MPIPPSLLPSPAAGLIGAAATADDGAALTGIPTSERFLDPTGRLMRVRLDGRRARVTTGPSRASVLMR